MRNQRGTAAERHVASERGTVEKFGRNQNNRQRQWRTSFGNSFGATGNDRNRSSQGSKSSWRNNFRGPIGRQNQIQKQTGISNQFVAHRSQRRGDDARQIIDFRRSGADGQMVHQRQSPSPE